MTERIIVYVGADAGYAGAQEVADGRAVVTHVPAEPAALAAALVDADALLDASMKVRITDVMVAAAPCLSIVSCATTGADHIERQALTDRGAEVRTLREDPELLRNLTPAAELSWALVLACARRLPAAAAHTRAGQWVREDFPGLMLNGRTLGLIGCGRIGQWMARYAAAFGMNVVGHDPHIAPWPAGIEQRSLAEVMAESDVVSVHVHLNDETRGLVSADLLAAAKPGLILVNTSRGAVVDEDALLAGLETGRIGAAGLDVLEGEPDIAAHPLIRYSQTHDNLIVTPHCGGFSPDAVRLVCRRAAEKILEHFGV